MGFRRNIIFYRKEIDESRHEPSEKERRAFSENGIELGIMEKIKSEFIRLSATFAFDCDLEFEEYSDVNKMIKKLRSKIYDIDIDDEISIDAIKKMIVYLDLQIGSKVSFYTTFIKMLDNLELEYDYQQLKEINLYDFDKLFRLFYQNSKAKFRKTPETMLRTSEFGKKKEKDFFDKKRIEQIVARIEHIKKRDLKMYYEYSLILNEVLSKKDELRDEDLFFARKILAYMEYLLSLPIYDEEIVEEMAKKGEFDTDYTKFVIKREMDLDYLKEKFNYTGNLYQRGRER